MCRLARIREARSTAFRWLVRSTAFRRLTPNSPQREFRLKAELQTDSPFAQMGRQGSAYQPFGNRLPVILEELNERLPA